MLLGLLDHALNLLVGKSRGRSDGDALVLVGGLVLGGDVDNSIGVDVEGNLDLGDTLGRGRDAHELEVAKELVVANELALSLEIDIESANALGSSNTKENAPGRP